ncbi:MAG: hypothetical protein Q9214_006189, partial [Letrouitia sp. 1 TL-2023]
MCDNIIQERQCSVCKRYFQSKRLKRHRKTQHPKCPVCRQRFESRCILHMHQKAAVHCYCQLCNSIFAKMAQHLKHVRKVSHKENFHCCDCKREYVDQVSLTKHCCVCDRVFRTPDGLRTHLSSKTHATLAKESSFQSNPQLRHKCVQCDKAFETWKALNSHTKSSHKPRRTIPCPIGTKCQKKFATPSALIDHLESGGCRAGMTRQKLNQLIILHDKDHHITDADATSRIFIMETEAASRISQEGAAIHTVQTPPSPASNSSDESVSHFPHFSHPSSPSISDSYSDLGGVLLFPSTVANPSEWSLLSSPRIESIADDSLTEPNLAAPLSITPSNLEKGGLFCPLCPSNRQRSFGSMLAFEQHLGSAAHAPKIFHCPMAFSVNVPEAWGKRKEK